LLEKAGLFGFRVASAKASSLISFGTAFGILRKLLVATPALPRLTFASSR
jgi:hypothetical protein